MHQVPENILAEIKRLYEERRSFIANYRGRAAWLDPECPDGEYDLPAPPGARCAECNAPLGGEYFIEIEGYFHCYEECNPLLSPQEFLALSAEERLAALEDTEEFYEEVEVLSSRPLLTLEDAESLLHAPWFAREGGLYAVPCGDSVLAYKIALSPNSETYRVLFLGELLR